MASLQVGSNWKGFYDAPLPYGRREFSCEITKITENQSFIGQGEDAEGNFSIKGSLGSTKTISEDGQESVTCDITFIKDYLADDGYKGVEYKGTLTDHRITGQYSFLWKKAFLSKTVTGIFEMEVVI